MNRRGAPRVTALAGGVGAARLLRGMARVVPLERLTVVVNTADDEEFYGLHVSPDVDTVLYNLAGIAPPERGWGVAGDSTRVLERLRRFDATAWFQLGDRDLATHLFRTGELRRGRPLHEVTAALARALGVRSRVLPMSDHPVRTKVHTRRGATLAFQEWFVRRGARDAVAHISYRGLTAARPAPGVLAAIRSAELLVLPPSNPFTSILPILGVRGVRRALRDRSAPAVAVSPVAAGRAVRGPLGAMLRAAGRAVSPLGVAALYRGLLDGLVIDFRDAPLAKALEQQGLAVAVTDIRMDTIERSIAVGRRVVALGRRLGAS